MRHIHIHTHLETSWYTDAIRSLVDLGQRHHILSSEKIDDDQLHFTGQVVPRSGDYSRHDEERTDEQMLELKYRVAYKKWRPFSSKLVTESRPCRLLLIFGPLFAKLCISGYERPLFSPMVTETTLPSIILSEMYCATRLLLSTRGLASK